MKKISILAITGFLFLAFSGIIIAETHKHIPAGASITIPDNWKVTFPDEDSLDAVSPSEEVTLMMTVLDANNLDVALSELDKEMGKIVKNFKEKGEPEKLKIGNSNMVAYKLKANGKIEGIRFNLSLALIKTPKNNKVLLIFGLVPSYTGSKYDKAIDTIIKSIKKLK
ncbi:MAG: hypothetical protein GY754_35835 [bacterium]|nr:hypothetical protein [bacterium]